MLGRVRVGPGEEQAPLGVVGPAGPHLAAGDDPAIASGFGHGTGRQPGQVRPGVGLGEQLAPDLLAPGDRRQPAPPLLGLAVDERGGAEQGQAHKERVEVGRLVAGQLAGDGRGLAGGRPAPAALRRPGWGRPPAGRQQLEEPAALVPVVLRAARAEQADPAAARFPPRQVALEQAPGLAGDLPDLLDLLDRHDAGVRYWLS
jgi:hypothetical protein